MSLCSLQMLHRAFINMITTRNKKKACEDFSPKPLDNEMSENIVKRFVDVTSLEIFEECSCTVCGELSLKLKMVNLSKCNVDLDILNSYGNGFTSKE